MAQKARKFLRVDLSSGIAREEDIPSEVVRDFIGGRGLGIKYLYDELSPNVDPLGPDNKLMLLTGPLAGSGAQSCSRWMVITKSPLTGAYIRSVGGANFAAALNFAGFDFVLCEGKAEEPVYLHIENGKGALKDAQELWGLDTLQTQEKLEALHGKKTRTACIGPSGENGVLYSGVVSGRRICARGGVGTVMGSKNLKAVAVSASGPLDLPDPEGFKKIVREEIEASARRNRGKIRGIVTFIASIRVRGFVAATGLCRQLYATRADASPRRFALRLHGGPGFRFPA